MPTFLKIVQEELKTKKRLMREDVYELAYKYKHDFDTARRALEPDKTPFSKPHKIGNRIKWWDYTQDEDLDIPNMAKAFKTVSKIVEENLNEVIRGIIKETPLSFDSREKIAELGRALTGDNFKKRSVIEKYPVRKSQSLKTPNKEMA